MNGLISESSLSTQIITPRSSKDNTHLSHSSIESKIANSANPKKISLPKNQFEQVNTQKRFWLKETIKERKLRLNEIPIIEILVYLTNIIGIGEPSIAKIMEVYIEKIGGQIHYETVRRCLHRIRDKGAITITERFNTTKGKFKDSNIYTLVGFEYKLAPHYDDSQDNLNSDHVIRDCSNNIDHYDRCNLSDKLTSYSEYEKTKVPMSQPKRQVKKQDYEKPKYRFSKADAKRVNLPTELENEINDNKLLATYKAADTIATLKALKCDNSVKKTLFINLLEYERNKPTGKPVKNVGGFLMSSFKFMLAEKGDPENIKNQNLTPEQLNQNCRLSETKQTNLITSLENDQLAVEVTKRLMERNHISEDLLNCPINGGESTIGILLMDTFGHDFETHGIGSYQNQKLLN